MDADGQHRHYHVFFTTPNGQTHATFATIIDGYSTLDDLPKMIAMQHGEGCEVTGAYALPDDPTRPPTE